jgi:hypothetical protein
MGVCEINADKTLKVYRNGKRPLYLSYLPNGCIITSTRDIAVRANINAATVESDMNAYLTIDDKLAVMFDYVEVEDSVDYQKYELC